MVGYNDKKLRRLLANIDERLTRIEAGIRGDAPRRSATKTQQVKEKPKAMHHRGAGLLLAALDAHRARSS